MLYFENYIYICNSKIEKIDFIMKRILFSVLALVAVSTQAQQSFAGLRTSYFGGVHQVLNNPANIAGSARNWDVNLFSIDANLGNNAMGFGFDLEKSFNEFTKLDNSNPLLSGNNINAGINVDVLAPSFFIQFGKHVVGITSRARVIADINNIDAKVLESFLVDNLDVRNYPSISLENQGITANAFTEIGLTWAGILFQDETHTIKGGASIKYVKGAGTLYAGIKDFSGRATLESRNNDLYLNIAGTGSLEVANGGVNYNDFKASDITNGNASTVGFDIGAVYEYRDGECPTCSGSTPYKFKAGISITDIGRLKYDINRESFRYTLRNAQLNLNDLSEEKLREAFPTRESLEGGSIKSSLPTALNLNFDYRIIGGLYVDVAGQLNLVEKNTYNATYANEVILTPRWENKYFGLYIPVTYNELSKTSLGTAFRIGPFFAGSRSVLSNLMSNNAKELSAYFGFRFGI